jgi:hypothetical protein
MSDSRDVATQVQGGEVVHQGRSSNAVSIPMDQRMAMLREALTNPDVNPEKAIAMADLMWRMEDRERESEFNRAKIAAIRDMPAIYKRGTNTHTSTRYAKFEDLHRAVMPVLARHGLTIDFRIGNEGRDITVQPLLRHENGFVEEGGIMRGPADEGKGRSAIQAVGSASSYLKRYTMRAMLNIIEDGEDDDGAGGASRQLNDRQEQLLVDAQEAHDRGQYHAWFNRLPVKDKALVIGRGDHARFGGAPLLPGQQRDDPPQQERRSDPPQHSKHDTSTPEGWTAQYADDCAAAPDREALQRVQAKGAKALDKLKADHPTLHTQAVKAGTDAFARLAGNAGGESTLFGGTE